MKDLCHPIPAPKNGKVKCSRSRHRTHLFYKTKCSFACNPGYKLIGPALKQCDGTGKWDEDTPMCIRMFIFHSFSYIKNYKWNLIFLAMSCSKLDKPKHGIITPSQCLTGDIYSGERCILHCDAGYKPTDHRVIICDPQQQWAPTTTLNCTRIPGPNIKPVIKCPSDVTKILPNNQETIDIKLERPKTNVDWWK